MPQHFADRLVRRLRRLGHPLCAGLDPHLDLVPEPFRRGSMAPGDPRTAAAVEDFLAAFLERLDGRVAVVKPQVAFFERLGWRGLRALEAVVARARGLGLEVLLDAKRGDVGSTAAAYAAAYLGPEPALEVDAMTLNPYLGGDALEPFLETLRPHPPHSGGRGVFVLVKTSNPGSGDFQDRALAGENAAESQGTLYEAVAASLAEPARTLRGAETGWSSLGVVVGATYPGESERVREILPHSLFLVPGYGAQGASAGAAVRGFVPGPGGRLEGGLVSSSRGLLFPVAGAGARGWERAVDEALDRATDELAVAVGP